MNIINDILDMPMNVAVPVIMSMFTLTYDEAEQQYLVWLNQEYEKILLQIFCTSNH